MSIVITGASGNIGSATLRELTAHDRHDVEAVARRLPATADPPHASVRWRAADVARDDLAPILEGARAVVHLAWKFQPTHRPDVTWSTNVAGTRRLLEAARRAEVPAVIYLSSIAAYSPRGSDDPVDETWPTAGTSGAAYCREKAMVERLLDAFEISNPQVRVVRLRPTFGFSGSPD